MTKKTIRIGTRGSKLALWQAEWVRKTLEQSFADLSVELEKIKTKGDKILDVPLAKVGGKGLFVKEIESAILSQNVDLAVHSMKDMPSEIPIGLKIGAVSKREDHRDVLITRTGKFLKTLPEGAKIGTSSLRRSAQLLHFRPDLQIVPLRGNLDTRMAKLESERLDGIVLAAAGVKRMRLEHRITEFLSDDIMMSAVGQGALCIEIRENDPYIEKLMTVIDHEPTRTAVAGERAFLQRLEGGCQVPIAAYGKIDHGDLVLSGLVADLDGRQVIRETLSGQKTDARQIGTALAERLIDQGAEKILDKLKAQFDEHENR